MNREQSHREQSKKKVIHRQNDKDERMDNLQIMDKLEKDGYNKVKELRETNAPVENILKCMKEGEQEFVHKVGRKMTYSEMRMLYG